MEDNASGRHWRTAARRHADMHAAEEERSCRGTLVVGCRRSSGVVASSKTGTAAPALQKREGHRAQGTAARSVVAARLSQGPVATKGFLHPRGAGGDWRRFLRPTQGSEPREQRGGLCCDDHARRLQALRIPSIRIWGERVTRERGSLSRNQHRLVVVSGRFNPPGAKKKEECWTAVAPDPTRGHGTGTVDGG